MSNDSPRDSFVKRVLALGAGSSTALVSTFVSSLAVVSLVGPSVFGRLGTALAAATVLEILLTGRKEQLFPVVEAGTLPGYYSATLRTTAGRALGVVIIAALLAVSGIFEADLLIASAMIGMGNAAYNLGSYRLLAKGQTRLLAARKAQCGILMGVALVATALVTSNLVWLAVAYTASRVPLGRPDRTWAAAAPRTDDGDRRASYHVFAGQLASNLALQAPIFMSGAFFGSVTTGYFVLGRRMIGQPAQLLTQSMSEALFGTTTALSPVALRRLAVRVLAATVVLSTFTGVVTSWLIGVVGPSVPQAWEGSLPYLPPIAVMAVSQVFTSPFATVLAIQRMERQRNIWLWTRLVMIVAVGYFSRHLPAEAFFWRVALVTAASYTLLPLYVLTRRKEIVDDKSPVGCAA